MKSRVNKMFGITSLFARLTTICTTFFLYSATFTARADFSDEYKLQESASWDKAQFYSKRVYTIFKHPNTMIEVEKESRYHVLKNGDVYYIGPNPLFPEQSFTNKVGNLYETKRSSGNTCFYGNNLACQLNIVYTDVQLKIENCTLASYKKSQLTRGGEFGKVERTALGTCREGFSQKN